MIWCGVKIKENCYALVNQFYGIFCSKTLCCRKIKSVFRDVKWCFNASWGLKGLKQRWCVLHVSCDVMFLTNPGAHLILFYCWHTVCDIGATLVQRLDFTGHSMISDDGDVSIPRAGHVHVTWWSDVAPYVVSSQWRSLQYTRFPKQSSLNVTPLEMWLC